MKTKIKKLQAKLERKVKKGFENKQELWVKRYREARKK